MRFIQMLMNIILLLIVILGIVVGLQGDVRGWGIAVVFMMCAMQISASAEAKAQLKVLRDIAAGGA